MADPRLPAGSAGAYPGPIGDRAPNDDRKGPAMTLDPQARIYLDKLAVAQPARLPHDAARRGQAPLPGHARAGRQARPGRGRRGPGHARLDPAPGLSAARPGPAGPLPVLVYFHGGGWVLGDLETVDNLCRRLANASGCAVVSVDYRLAPETKFPGPLDDCFEAVEFVADEADVVRDRSGTDRRRRRQRGGNLAAAVALKARDRGRPPDRLPVPDLSRSPTSRSTPRPTSRTPRATA